MSIADMLNLKTWAVVGATNNKSKFGYKIYHYMKKAGLEVYPVNPGIKEIDGDTCYATLADLPNKPDAVDMVVPPSVGEKILEQCDQLGIRHVWFQPGSDTKKLLELAETFQVDAVHDACIMVELKKRG